MASKNYHSITDVEFIQGSAHQGDVLSYIADGAIVNVTGEFYCDSRGVYHHGNEFSDGSCIDVTW